MDSNVKSFNSTVKLHNSLEMPIFGFGTYLLQNVNENIKNAIKLGYRCIDTAKLYHNEDEIGKAINELLADKTIKREDIFVTTKLWNDDQEDPVQELRNSLKRLQLDYVDLFLVHWPIGKTNEGVICKQTPIHIIWQNMEKCVELGLTKSIGVSNYSVQLLSNLISFAKIKPVCNQVEVHPLFSQEGLFHYCKQNDIAIVAYNPLCNGKSARNNLEFDKYDLSKNKLLSELAAKYKKTNAQIILNWHVWRGVCVIPKSNNVERQRENLESMNFKMEEEDYNKISNLNINKRFVLSKGKPFCKDYDVFA